MELECIEFSAITKHRSEIVAKLRLSAKTVFAKPSFWCTVLYLNINFWGTAYSYIVESYEILLTFRYKKIDKKNLF